MSGNIAMPFCWLEWRNLLREKTDCDDESENMEEKARSV